MIYILGVLAVSMATTGRSYSLISSLLSVLIFNCFFTHPYFTLMSDPGYLVTFGIMFIVALLVSSLTTRIKGQAILSANKAYRTEILLETSRKLQTAEGPEAILSATAAHSAPSPIRFPAHTDPKWPVFPPRRAPCSAVPPPPVSPFHGKTFRIRAAPWRASGAAHRRWRQRERAPAPAARPHGQSFFSTAAGERAAISRKKAAAPPAPPCR